ncbi:hypothetical protein HX815_15050 [Pseudomonas sp. E6002]|uniref:hypothetical protein n=1 Tax=Pseudomonas sp. E6002 TaxID=2738820 RepID=UPI0015A2BB4E|nr:hypothetical protein [Pseudomonas sp. E6002]NWB41628.1 hypothetical protein [Pseudomonas sp. E6002]
MDDNKYLGKTLAYSRFKLTTWKTESMLSLGVVGIDEKITNSYSGLLNKFDGIKGVPGPKPKDYKPQVSSERMEDGDILVTLDDRAAAFLKKVLLNDKKRHDDLRFFLYSNIFVSVWGSFETYTQMLFEELLQKKPEMLKSKETMLLDDIITHRNNIIPHLIERQVEAIGHFKIDDLLSYINKKINVTLEPADSKHIKDLYTIRNIIAHKSGLVRESQIKKIPAGVKVIGGELRISEAYLKKMIKFMEKIVAMIERAVDDKFFHNDK